MNVSLSSIISPFSRFFSKYHATIFFTIVSLLLSGAILSLYLTTQTSEPDPSTLGETINSNFDEETAEKIKNLRESDESENKLVFPVPRSNPFVE